MHVFPAPALKNCKNLWTWAGWQDFAMPSMKTKELTRHLSWWDHFQILESP
jgi:hypothetical protein